MLYIQQTRCISPQQSFGDADLATLRASAGRQLLVMEPNYPGVSPGALRRMGKAGRIGMGTAMSILENGATANGIIIGTANGGMEESIRFIKQIVEYNEDMLAPGSFVQSTANATAAQLAMLKKNHGYNITHVHRALAFENSLVDAGMLLKENPGNAYLVGGVDEIASYNFRIECAAGWYKDDNISNADLYNTDTPGSIAGEGAAMFLVSDQKENAIARLVALTTIHSKDIAVIHDRLKHFIQQSVPAGEKIDLFLSGENGDNRYTPLFTSLETLIDEEIAIARFKHICGEYPTASAFALWLACNPALIPAHAIKRAGVRKEYKRILIANSHHGNQHSFMLVEVL